MTQHPDTGHIEAELERSRARLNSAVDALQDRTSVESLAQEALSLIRSNAAVYTRSIDNAVRANPIALALTGVGIAWLVFGNRKTTQETTRARWEDEGGYPNPSHQLATPEDTSPEIGDWAGRIDALRERASQALRDIDSEARSYAGDLRGYAAERAKVLASFTEDMRVSLLDGLEGLSEVARDRIVKAREAAYLARLRVSRTARAGGRETERLINEHPMIAGVLAMALGAAFAAALPRTRVEDRTFGAESDRLMDAAAAMLREERERMERVASGVADELKTSARDVAETAADKAAEIGDNLRDRAQAEAKRGKAAPKPA
ncbi:DUF3618 domain-containing protein [Defluviimonas sp. SAOS-178_SWC]|uniref:DUF3618 domain-containing protein n=1 Tax=Defluviimonas sp. SAOS-178_SWC TaxID=3121287 RepID=UPI00322218FB